MYQVYELYKSEKPLFLRAFNNIDDALVYSNILFCTEGKQCLIIKRFHKVLTEVKLQNIAQLTI